MSGKVLVHGFSLLEKAKKLGVQGLYVIELRGMDTHGLLLTCLRCESRPGHYSWPEKARITALYSPEELRDQTIIKLIEGHDDPYFYKKIGAYNNFTPSLKTLVDKEILDFKTAVKIRDLPDNVFSALLDWKKNKKPSFSTIRIFSTNLYEISQRDHIDKSAIIKLCRELLSEKNPEKAVKKVRNPELTGLYERLNRVREQVLKTTGVELKEPPYFEGDSFEVRFCFNTKKQLEKKIQALNGLKERTDELFELL